MFDLRPSRDDGANRLLQMINGYRSTCLIATGIQLGIFEAVRTKPVSGPQLATELDADFHSLLRFVRALRVLGLVELRDGAIGLTETGRLLLRGKSALSDRAHLAIAEYLPAWANLRHSVRTGRPAFDDVFGMTAWDHRQVHPALGESFQQIMSEDQRQSSGAVVEAFDFGISRTVVDVGGGFGSLLTEILTKHSTARGILFDRPEVVAAARGHLAASGVLDRCDLVGGSFFETVPHGGDVYILQHILHDWNEEQCVRILRHCRAAMNTSSRLLVVENILPENAAMSEHTIMLDLHMLAVLGGRERTVVEYEAMFSAAGLFIENSQKSVKDCFLLTVMTNRAQAPS